MEQLDSQVSDLRSFLPPAGLSPLGEYGGRSSISAMSPSAGAGGPHHSSSHSTPFSAPGDNSAQPPTFSPGGRAISKRKPEDNDDGGARQQRSKRNRYISIACNECKRRKIKCNGETPCQRCGNLNLACLYSPNCCSNNFRESEDFRQMTEQVTRLQEQVDTLFNNMNALRQETLRLAPIQDRILPLPSTAVTPSPSTSSILSLPKPQLNPQRVPPSFSGPTSTAFTVDVAKNTLHNMGYSGAGDGSEENGMQPEETPTTSPDMRLERRAFHKPADPLWEFDKDEMIRLCRVHEEEVGIMYPVLKIETIIEHARKLATWMEASKRNGLIPQLDQEGGISDMRSLELKIIMCCALAVEEHGNSAKATRLYDSIHAIVDRKLMNDLPDVSNLPFLALVGGYRFLSNDEILAWRVMGQVARLCLEMGLHRREGLTKIAGEQDRKNALNTFWTAYVLDRRWSFGTGLPYVIRDENIDPKLEYPDEFPYLVAMITYSKLGAKIWKLVDYFEPAIILELKRDDFESLDREILEWYETVPAEVRISNLSKDMPLPSAPSYNLQRLQIWTRLRLNQIRIWLHTPVLHSASSIHDNMGLAQRAVDLAKDTIQYLTRLNSQTNLYRKIQVFYHQFLTSAIAVLFLASTHAPLQFSANCRTEFYMALELVRDMSVKSWVSQRLWRTIGSLKNYAPRLGLAEDEAHSNAAATMAHLAAGSLLHKQVAHTQSPSPVSLGPFGPRQSSFAPPPPPPSSTASTPTPQYQQQQPQGGVEERNNGLKLQTEMSRIFEGYTGGPPEQQQQHDESHPRPSSSPGFSGPGLDAPAEEASSDMRVAYAGNGSVYEHFRDMF